MFLAAQARHTFNQRFLFCHGTVEGCMGTSVKAEALLSQAVTSIIVLSQTAHLKDPSYPPFFCSDPKLSCKSEI